MPLPPGPRPIPFLGNTLSIDKYQPWLTCTGWRKQYGELVHVNLIGQTAITIDSSSLAHRLLDQRSRKYSIRPVFALAKLFGWDFSTTTMPYGERLRRHRRIYHQEFRAEAITPYHQLFRRKAHELLCNLLYLKLPMNTTSIAKHPFVTLISDAMRLIVQSASSERAALVAAIPILARIPPWFPGAGFIRRAQRSQKLAREMQDSGVETTASKLLMFLLAMALNPTIQVRAQAEIDSIIGSETLWWYPVVPLGTPHSTVEDDIYEGYHVPTDIFTCIRFTKAPSMISRDNDPESFDPSRFVTSERQLNDDSTVVGFGFGRRICPGRHVAATVVWMMIVSVLAVFKVEKMRDDEVNEVEIVPEFWFGPSIHPLIHFPCQFRPRSIKMEGLIKLAASA
ncbi:hypothetical protein SERLA73DRAFT_69572 [Serpula lacrymans var. lacrymans S7.3]|uniref:Cytochrome P450 n=1 Tax=Serpula lacrymans var. lacrymans (strain S7.3) TaxID=936435 RepID=F8PJB2_SERL3|nr:hypothetical protein SERLA73DRAFT_69572 [Serpula lacrymans var. lacrymans S7.3]